MLFSAFALHEAAAHTVAALTRVAADQVEAEALATDEIGRIGCGCTRPQFQSSCDNDKDPWCWSAGLDEELLNLTISLCSQVPQC